MESEKKKKAASQHYRQYCQSELLLVRMEVGKLNAQAPGELKVGGVMNASGGNTASEVIWCTRSKERTEGERNMSASPGRKGC